MNNAKKMPDAYYKGTDGNLYKLMQLIHLLYEDVNSDLISILESHDLANAYGATLDNYGASVGVDRNGASDAQYRTMILNRIGKIISTGDCNTVIELISQMLGIDKSEVHITEIGSAKVSLSNISFETLENSGFDGEEAVRMIKGLLPIGVSIGESSFAGTFQYGSVEGETSETTGFDVGTLGMIM